MKILNLTKIEKDNKLNRGQYLEKVAHNYFGIDYKLDNNNHLTSSDIELDDLKISVKSYNCSLDNNHNHNNLENSINEFIENDYSNQYLYITQNMVSNNYNGYLFNKEEFKKFLQLTSCISDGKFRIRKNDNKVNTIIALNF